MQQNNNNSDNNDNDALEVGLVLGGGGARGLAHIGVLEVLAAAKLTPVAISGCSMGAIVGAFFAAGYSPSDMIGIVKDLDFVRLLRFGERGGLIGQSGIAAFLNMHLPETFAELALPLTMTAVDVQKGTLLTLSEGPLVPALLATSALPGIFSPVAYKGRFLVDGGLLNNVPVDIITTMTLAPVVAVDVSAPANRALELIPKDLSLFERITSVVKGERSLGEDLLKRSLTLELLMKTFDIPQKVLTAMRLSLQYPDVLICPELDATFGIENFERYNEAITQGAYAARKSLANWAPCRAQMGYGVSLHNAQSTSKDFSCNVDSSLLPEAMQQDPSPNPAIPRHHGLNHEAINHKAINHEDAHHQSTAHRGARVQEKPQKFQSSSQATLDQLDQSNQLSQGVSGHERPTWQALHHKNLQRKRLSSAASQTPQKQHDDLSSLPPQFSTQALVQPAIEKDSTKAAIKTSVTTPTINSTINSVMEPAEPMILAPPRCHSVRPQGPLEWIRQNEESQSRHNQGEHARDAGTQDTSAAASQDTPEKDPLKAIKKMWGW